EELPETPLVEVDLTELAEHAAQDTRAAAPDRQVVVNAGPPVRVLGDPAQLRQVLSNLTRNGVIHTAPGTAIEITVATEGERALIEVRDHGPGLPPDAGNRLFDRFWRTEGGRTRGRGGAGLGLAIVKAIVDAHHGEVDARTAEGGGAVFTATLPLIGDAPAVGSAVAPQAGTSPGHG